MKRNISVDNIHSYANYYQNFKFSDGDILLDYAICSPINGTDFEFAVAPLVASAKVCIYYLSHLNMFKLAYFVYRTFIMIVFLLLFSVGYLVPLKFPSVLIKLQNVTSQCELEQNWYQPIQQGSSVNIDFSGFLIFLSFPLLFTISLVLSSLVVSSPLVSYCSIISMLPLL